MTPERSEPPSNQHALPAAVTQSSQLTSTRDGVLQPGYGYGAAVEGHNLGSQLWEYWRILNKRRWLVLGLALGTMLVTGLATLLETPLYTSTIRLQIDKAGAKPLDNGEVRPADGFDLDFLKTQYELLQGRSMAERVVSSLKLGTDVSFLQPAGYSVFGSVRGLFQPRVAIGTNAAADERRAARVVLENRSIRPLPGSRLVDLQYVDPSPPRAQRVVSALADAYIASNIDKRFEANAYSRTFLEDQTKQLKIRLEESEKVMLDFAQREKIVASTEKASVAENNLASANTALGVLISERIKTEQQFQQVQQATAINLPQLLTNAVIDGLRGRRNLLVTEYQEKLETFKPDYPQMVQIKNKISEIDRQLTTEIATIKSSFKAAFEASAKQESDMRAQVEKLKVEVLDLQQRSIQFNILKREVDSNRAIYDSLLQRFKQVDIAGGVGANNVFIVDRAEIPGSPSSPLLGRALALSLGFGLFAGIALAFVLEHLDNTIRTVDELERATGCVTLGIVPRAADTSTADAELADPRSALSEAYRSLATALQFSTEKGLPWSILFTSAGPGEGKSTSAIAMTRHFSSLGLKVLLIDADLRNPSVHSRLGLANDRGLSNALTGACDATAATQSATIGATAGDFHVITAGPIPPNPAELLGSSRMPSLLSWAAEGYNLVIIDAPPVMGLADAPILASLGGATLFVAAAGQARLTPVREALKRLQLARAQVLGAVLTKFDARAAGYGYGYGYGYGGYGQYGYGQYGYGQQAVASKTPSLGRPNHAAANARPIAGEPG